MKNIIFVGTVNFRSYWKDKQLNLKRICEYAEQGAKRGVNLIAFPEMALTGYDHDFSVPDGLPSQQAEPIPGPSTREVQKVAMAHNIIVVFGMPEILNGKIYNSAAVCMPDGAIHVCRKLFIPRREGLWATPGDKPCLIDTPWGPLGISICYDSYQFPELIRYFRAMGARMFVNCTACGSVACAGARIRTELEATVIMNNIYAISASLTGQDHSEFYIGGSSIVGPSTRYNDVFYYAGKPFHAPDSSNQELYSAVIDLTLAQRNTVFSMFEKNPIRGEPDWRPNLVQKMLQEILEQPLWKDTQGGT